MIPSFHRKHLILVGSITFYAAWDWRYLSLLFLLSLVNFGSGIAIYESKQKKVFLFSTLTFNFSLLFVFKYYGFFLTNLSVLLEKFGFSFSINTMSIIVPLGISFFIFQVSSYVIDIYRQELKPTRDLVSFSAFVAYFPHMAAGPIMKAKVLLPQIISPKNYLDDKLLLSGLGLIGNGLFRKIVIADTLAPMVNRIFSSSQTFDWKSLVLASLAFGLQIYGDFSGYSNIARGTSRLLGIELSVNFRQPYFSRNIQEFWRSWHISLSNWFKDYLYIPLGGNKTKRRARTYFNLWFVMVIAGLWHGAAWGFLIWGFLHGFLLILHRMFTLIKSQFTNGMQRIFLTRIQQLLSLLLTNVLVFTLWTIFRNPQPSEFTLIFSRIVQRAPGTFEIPDFVLVVVIILLVIVLDILEILWQRKSNVREYVLTKPILAGAVVGIMTCFALAVQSSDVIPFVYFQF